MTWHELIEEKLGLSRMSLRPESVPFGMHSALPMAHGDWIVDRFEETSPETWTLTARTARGLEATWNARFFASTRALECWGEIANRGSEAIPHVTQARTLDVNFALNAQVGLPWVRSLNGVRHIPASFPPHDFKINDCQMMQQVDHVPLRIGSVPEGWTSGGGAHVPMLLLCDERQQHGCALFLEWAGQWEINVEAVTSECQTPFPAEARLALRVALCGLDLHLQPGQTLPLPRVLFCAFDGDLDAGGNALRRHIRRHVAPQLGGKEVLPPTSFNHWFAFGNDFSAESLKPAVEASAAAGLEYFCVDGGWYRGDFRDGIGNWEEGDPAKFPDGIKPFSDYVSAQGLKYGTWFEPEWAQRDSDLYQAHPDWFWPAPPNSGFHMMNFGLPAVREWWLQRFIRAYREWGMRWVRWDFNGAPGASWAFGLQTGEIGWRQIEHVTGLYQVLDDIMAACPELLIEQCASGGHRIELGTVRRGHTFWMNDHTTNTDIVRFMQHGLNTILPGNYPNTNLCQARFDFTDYDFLSHVAGGFGYSGRLWEMPPADFERFKAAVARFKEYRHLLLGDYARPTGQAQRYSEYSQVVFRAENESLSLEFNLPEEARSAALRRF